MNDWIRKMRATRATFFVYVSSTSETTVHVWCGKNALIVQKEDTDAALQEALQYAENYDAYINTAPGCHH